MNPHITKEEEKAFKLAKYYNLGTEHAAVTKSDSVTFNPSAIRVGTAGTITVADTKGRTEEYTAQAGEILPVLCTAVLEGGSATNIIRIW